MSEKPGIPQVRPATIIGTASVSALHAAGFRIVPSIATSAMKDAAAQAMRRRDRELLGLPWVSNKEKAAIRWEAMLAAWTSDYGGMTEGRKLDPLPEHPPRWKWSIGRFFELAVDWSSRASNWSEHEKRRKTMKDAGGH